MQQASWIDVLHSRKFWALVIALLAIVAGYATQQLDAWQAIQAAVAALAAYSTGVAIEDAGFKAGPGRTPAPPAALPPAESPIGSGTSQVNQSSTGILGPPSMPPAGVGTVREPPLQVTYHKITPEVEDSADFGGKE